MSRCLTSSRVDVGEQAEAWQCRLTSMVSFPKAPCSVIVNTWALKGLAYHNLGGNVYTIKLHGAFGFFNFRAFFWSLL